MIDDLDDSGDLVNIGTVVDEDNATNFDKLGVHLRKEQGLGWMHGQDLETAYHIETA